MRVVGFDYNGVINKYPKIFAGFSRALKQSGVKVVVISAYSTVLDEETYLSKLIKEFNEINFVYDRIILTTFDRQDPTTIPGSKLIECKKYQVEQFYDDRGDVIKLLNENGIEGIRV